MLDVGTTTPASITLGIRSLISEALYNIESFFETIEINNILFLLAYCIMFLSSLVSPELLINIKISFLEIIPKSPCEASLADRLNDGVPTDARVEAIFEAIRPLLPTPHKIIFDWHFEIFIIALLNSDELIVFLSFFNALISSSITFLAMDTNFFLFISEPKYLP